MKPANWIEDELSIKPVISSDDIRNFIMLPKHIYVNDPLWVPPLYYEEKKHFSVKNPYLRNNPYQLFIAMRGKKVIGRIAASVCKSYNEYWHENTGFFGFFECQQDDAAAHLLLDSASRYLRGLGMNKMRGPFNFSSNHTCGLLIQGHPSSPLIEMTYNPGYYIKLFEMNGLYKSKDLLAYWIDLTKELPKEKTMELVVERFHRDKISIRNINTKGAGFERDMDMFYDVYHTAWKDNWGFTPIDKEEYNFIVKRMRPLINPDLVLIAEKEGEPAGFYFTLPDFNQVVKAINGKLTPLNLIRILFLERKINSGRMILAGVMDKYRHTRLASLMLYQSLKAAVNKGYKGVEFSWILEDNVAANSVLENYDIPVYKRYRIFEKSL